MLYRVSFKVNGQTHVIDVTANSESEATAWVVQSVASSVACEAIDEDVDV